MRTRLRQLPLALAIALGLCVMPTLAVSQDVDEARQQLDAIGQEIKAATHNLATTRMARDSANTELRKLETALSETHRRLAELQEEQVGLEQQMDKLQERHEHLNTERDEQLAALGKQLSGLYRLGSTPELKLLLNQDDPARLDRFQTYLNRLAEARREILDKLDQLETALIENRKELAEQRKMLDELALSLEEHGADLAQQAAKREKLVAKLDSQFATDEARVVKLDQDRAHAEHVLRQVQESLERLNRPPPSTGIEYTQGDLPWPTQGRIKSSYHADRGVHRNGLVIATGEGSPVRAVHAGRVVFADWMRGFGNMLIIDHGDHVMTLHGHLQHFSVEVGQPVQRGDTLGAVGTTGGQSAASLYFEVRRDGSPIDPNQWMTQR